MATKENQHYVSKFYLREFSYQNNRKQIGLFNIKTGFFHATAKLKFQASKKNYYGENAVIENYLAELEGLLATATQNVINNEVLPTPHSDYHFRLLTFLVLSDLRTPVHENTANDSTDQMIKMIYKNHPDFQDHVDDVRIKFSDSAVLGIKQMQEIIPVALDLGFKLLLNETNIPFITSDNPVVKYNILLEQKNVHGGIVGLGTIGLIVFVPLSADHMLVFYDTDSYSIGTAGKDTFEVKHESVVNDLNLLHFLNCDSTIFFDDQANEGYIRNLFAKSNSFSRANQVIVTEHPVMDQFRKVGADTILHSRTTECRTNLQLPFVKILPKAKQYQPTTMAHMRPHARKLIDLELIGPKKINK